MLPPDIALLRRRLSQKYPLVQRSVDVDGRLWRLTAVQDQETLIDAVDTDDDLRNFPYGMLLWASAIGLARHIADHPELVRDRRVLELGAGAGLPGMVAASLGATVTQTDYQADPLALAKINAWDSVITTIEQSIGDWQNWNRKEAFDVVIGSDVLYERSLHFDLERLFERYAKKGARIVLSDPVRPQAMEFVTHLEKRGWAVAMETRDVHWEGEEKEIVFFDLAHG